MPDDWIKRLTENYRGIKFAKGVVGKTGYAIMGLCAIWAIIVWRLNESLIQSGGLLFAGILATAIFAWWVKSTQAFAERNPAQAMLDGAEFLEYSKFEAQAKGQIFPRQNAKLADPNSPTPMLTERPKGVEE